MEELEQELEQSEAEAPPETAAPEPASAPVIAPVAQPSAAPGADPMAPVKALLDERDRRQSAEREVKELRAWREQQERARQEAAAQAPNPIEDPEGFASWVQGLVGNTRKQVISEIQAKRMEDRISRSRYDMEQKLGPKFGELAKFIDDAPDAMHLHAQNELDPYGWFERQRLAQEKARRAEEVTAKLGDRSLDDIINERIAAAKAEWEAASQAADPGQPRGPDGKFAPLPSTQRRSAPSLSQINGAPAPGGDATPTSALEGLYGE